MAPRPPHIKDVKKGFIEPKMLAKKKTSLEVSPPTCSMARRKTYLSIVSEFASIFYTPSSGEGEERKEPSERMYMSYRQSGGEGEAGPALG